MTKNPSYFAVIPANVRYDKDLSPNAKLMYGEITALTHAKGHCFATNEYFAKLYNFNKNSISRLITQLESRCHIHIEVERNERGTSRKIWINIGPPKSEEGGTQKSVGGVLKNEEHNSTSSYQDKKEQTSIPFAEIVSYLNVAAETKFRDIEATREKIRGRYRDGFVLDDFKNVIDWKVKEWGKDTKMKKYIRPETLFSTKFGTYLADAEVSTLGRNDEDRFVM